MSRLSPKGEGAWIHEPLEVYMEGRKGMRYWVYNPYTVTGVKAVDDRLCSYPVYVFQPQNRHDQLNEIPIVFALQGMAAPLDWNSYIIPTLLDMGIAVVLMDTPLGGLRSVGRHNNGNVALEISSITALGVTVDVAMLEKLVEVLWTDYQMIHKEIIIERHKLTSDKIALFGTSLGVILSGCLFCREGFGQRILGTIGHFDVPRFARSYIGAILPNLATSFIGNGIEWLLHRLKPDLLGFIPLLRLLKGLMDIPDTSSSILNPLFYKNRVGDKRKVAVMIGDKDPLLNSADAIKCCDQFKNGACYVVPGLAHGTCFFGPDFVHHARYFLQTQLDDWKTVDSK
eukprot:TRINITY_DN1897_c0_g1_i2.p1 TRINITY_DN1897_c0_g1~~TRINITY_DN1897_c0_g1_i2.p1  ORF type:complete len:342 (+),score=78.71 TRINITY_DN1897_c0_g1_i2:134-1159(+)